jgi:hypothetical protein
MREGSYLMVSECHDAMSGRRLTVFMNFGGVLDLLS